MASTSYSMQSVESARASIEDMLAALAEPESPGFSKSCIDKDSVKLLDCERDSNGRRGRVVVEMQITDKMSNQMGNLHGGAQATLIDNLTSQVIYLHTSGVLGEPWSMLGVSQSMQILYTAPIPVESWCDFECTTLAIGKSVAVIQCDIWIKDGQGGKRVRRGASGTHTKVDNSAQARM